MSDLAEFLLARIAEDEEAARRAGSESWLHRSLMRHPTSRQSVYAEGREIAEVEHADGWHIARHDPARVLAECEAKRRIVGHLMRCLQPDEPDISPQYDDGYIDALDFALKLLALPYADHPDYDPAWRL
jgi:hypothetical protein